MIESAGAEAGMRVLDAMLEPCSKIDSALQLSEGDTVLAVERVRTADDQPVIYSREARDRLVYLVEATPSVRLNPGQPVDVAPLEPGT